MIGSRLSGVHDVLRILSTSIRSRSWAFGFGNFRIRPCSTPASPTDRCSQASVRTEEQKVLGPAAGGDAGDEAIHPLGLLVEEILGATGI